MSLLNRILFFFILPIVGIFLYPPDTLSGGFVVVLVLLLLFIGLGVLLLQGRSLALTFSIFLQGMNVIIRIMMFFANGFTTEGVPDLLFVLANILAIAVSVWLVTRLDKQDIRLTMVR